MNQNIKYIIYFLLGIIINYLLFNYPNIEGFDVNCSGSFGPCSDCLQIYTIDTQASGTGTECPYLNGSSIPCLGTNGSGCSDSEDNTNGSNTDSNINGSDINGSEDNTNGSNTDSNISCSGSFGLCINCSKIFTINTQASGTGTPCQYPDGSNIPCLGINGSGCNLPLSDSISVCSPNPCHNGGICSRNTDTNSYSCNCISNYSGTQCDNISVIVNQPCSTYSNGCSDGQEINNSGTCSGSCDITDKSVCCTLLSDSYIGVMISGLYIFLLIIIIIGVIIIINKYIINKDPIKVILPQNK